MTDEQSAALIRDLRAKTDAIRAEQMDSMETMGRLQSKIILVQAMRNRQVRDAILQGGIDQIVKAMK